MSSNILGSILNTQNLISLCIRNLNSEFILNGHYNLYGIKGVEAEIIGEFGGWCYL